MTRGAAGTGGGERATLAAVAEGSTIVVVEDDPAIADVVELYLRREGHRVLRASDGDTALAVIGAAAPALAILDVGLPEGPDGFEVCRRLRSLPRTAGAPSRPMVITVGRVEVDLGRREARVDGGAVALATREFDLLAHLARNAGLALSRRQLLDGVWGEGWVKDDRTVDVHVRQLRRKLGDGLDLATVWGVGYRLG